MLSKAFDFVKYVVQINEREVRERVEILYTWYIFEVHDLHHLLIVFLERR